MRSLESLLLELEVLEIRGSIETMVDAICSDHRQAGPGKLLVAIRGSRVDGHAWVAEALQAGVSAVVVEQALDSWASAFPHQTLVRVSNSAVALGRLASAMQGHPSRGLDLVGVTGTNGKTSVVTLLHQVFTGMGFRCGLISTVECRVGDRVLPSTHTTPDALRLNELLWEMKEAQCRYVFMEVSSHAMAQYRVSGLKFRGGVFTNLTRDHLDYHGTMENYFLAKRSFFDGLESSAFALYNADDAYGPRMVSCTDAMPVAYSLKSSGQDNETKMYRGTNLVLEPGSMRLDTDGTALTAGLTGRFNAYNVMAVWSVARLLQAEPGLVAKALAQAEPPQGRMWSLRGPDERWFLVDYAHTPDALQQVLTTLKDLQKGEGRLGVVFGCGGDRDEGKRPLMAEVAYTCANFLVMTSDNPRSEEPRQILDQMLQGLPKDYEQGNVLVESDRDQAIGQAVRLSRPGDIILVAGKGHETYQEIQGKRYPFSDQERLQYWMNTLLSDPKFINS
jgi:UDP-N-acetylmuramoyl-L-alanyl-D-glutamate--2,6-diaminopimelate ligase